MTIQFPALYQAADAASGRSQERVFLWIGLNLVLFVVVSILGAIAGDSPQVWMLCAGLLLCNFGLTVALAMAKPEENWYAARAIAESVKTATWRFVSRAEPFQDADEERAVRAFVERLRQIFLQNKRFSAQFTEALNGQQVPNELLLARRRSLAERIGYYRDLRILDQKTWYSDKARRNRRWAEGILGATLLFMALAVVVHAWRALDSSWPLWPGGIVVAIAMSFLTWLQAKRYQELSESYSVAAQDIAMVEVDLGFVSSEDQFSKFVADAESAFSREHIQWVARKDF